MRHKTKVIKRTIVESCIPVERPPQPCPPVGRPDYWVNNTVFVDTRYGRTTGVPEDPTKPFLEISDAISFITGIPTDLDKWIVQVRPGIYSPFSTINNIDVIGDSREACIVTSTTDSIPLLMEVPDSGVHNMTFLRIGNNSGTPAGIIELTRDFIRAEVTNCSFVVTQTHSTSLTPQTENAFRLQDTNGSLSSGIRDARVTVTNNIFTLNYSSDAKTVVPSSVISVVPTNPSNDQGLIVTFKDNEYNFYIDELYTHTEDHDVIMEKLYPCIVVQRSPVSDSTYTASRVYIVGGLTNTYWKGSNVNSVYSGYLTPVFTYANVSNRISCTDVTISDLRSVCETNIYDSRCIWIPYMSGWKTLPTALIEPDTREPSRVFNDFGYTLHKSCTYEIKKSHFYTRLNREDRYGGSFVLPVYVYGSLIDNESIMANVTSTSLSLILPAIPKDLNIEIPIQNRYVYSPWVWFESQDVFDLETQYSYSQDFGLSVTNMTLNRNMEDTDDSTDLFSLEYRGVIRIPPESVTGYEDGGYYQNIVTFDWREYGKDREDGTLIIKYTGNSILPTTFYLDPNVTNVIVERGFAIVDNLTKIVLELPSTRGGKLYRIKGMVYLEGSMEIVILPSNTTPQHPFVNALLGTTIDKSSSLVGTTSTDTPTFQAILLARGITYPASISSIPSSWYVMSSS